MTLAGVPVLVAGATGFVGTNLVKRLLAEGASIRATVHLRRPTIEDPRIQYVAADLMRLEDCEAAVAGQRMVFMCAASTSGAATISSTPMVHVTPNVVMNSLMLQAAYDAGCEKFVWLSSTTGYPDTGSRPVKEQEMFDGEPFEKYYFVGWMKRFTEILCKMYGEKLPRRMATIVLRPTNIYGPHDDFEPQTSHVTAALIRKVVERQDPIEVWGTGQDERDIVYVDDMVDAIVLAAETLDRHEAINVGFGRTYTVSELLELMVTIDGHSTARIVFNPGRPTTIPVRQVDTSLARGLLGFSAAITPADGIARTIDWYRGASGRRRPGP